MTVAGISISEQCHAGIHRLGQVQIVGQEAGAGWEWMCSSIFSHLQNCSSSNLGGELYQGHKCPQSDMSLEGSWRGVSGGHPPPGEELPQPPEGARPQFSVEIPGVV